MAAKASFSKAKGRARIVSIIYIVINYTLLIGAFYFLFQSFGFYTPATENAPQTDNVKLDAATGEVEAWICLPTFVVSFIAFSISFAQILGATMLFAATLKSTSTTEGNKMVTQHQNTQWFVLFTELLLVLILLALQIAEREVFELQLFAYHLILIVGSSGIFRGACLLIVNDFDAEIKCLLKEVGTLKV
ncbi:hypothetical protein Ocin01_15493 [Orchesella cincta]|uniref:Transmembrane protein n=1 Tax=Orchesella cincta TaxID=48709 RepID=A0A1D2ME18_ORCCI|nr:hypothetical protein Ocin01_15493 [Orchesella cincta]